MTGTGDAVLVSFMIMLVIITYFCTEWTIMTLNPQFGLEAVAAPTNVEVGIDQATLMRYPRVTYSQANLDDKGTTASCCCICLYDFEDTDVLRLLPQCGHPFHLDCVDPWLRSHSSCPICRSFAAPRAEVVSSTQPTRSQ
ncbi:RING-H2 finger protein ATL70-like [Musa acuminata AAA Group]|uniref:RING-H2 finger protein ATL70-like n=1 Tax=Musa acuminata AAA Group TaxID=214697 RepID=UPI0031D5DD99